MKRVCVVGSGVALPLFAARGGDTLAYVPMSQSFKESELMAMVLGLPYRECGRVFRLSPQCIRVTPTLLRMRELGSGVYESLPQSFVNKVNWPAMRSLQSELITAFLLSRALKAEAVHIMYQRSTEAPSVPSLLVECFQRNGIQLCLKPQT